MLDLTPDNVLKYLLNSQNYERDFLLEIINGSSLEIQGILFSFLHKDEYGHRFGDCLSDTEKINFDIEYCLNCIESSPDGEWSDSRYTAAYSLCLIVSYLVSRNWEKKVLKSIVSQIEDLFLRGDNEVKICIETGFLEHFLETKKNRKLFVHWNNNKDLQKAFLHSLQWGKKHKNSLGE